MSDETIFLLVNYSVLPAWLLLVALPHAAPTRALVHSGAFCAVLAVAYGILLFGDHPGPQGASFFTLEGVSRIFTTPRTIIACWTHYLVLDLFAGAWIVRDCKRIGLPHLACVPCVVGTLMFGPLGLLGWLAVRGATRRKWTLAESPSPV
jgi:hypothetical protein